MRLRFVGAMMLILAGCHTQPAATLASKAQLAEAEGQVSACTAATGRLTPLIATAKHDDLAHATIDARNRCSTARAALDRIAKSLPALAVCQQDMDAQERVSIAELALLDGPSAERRAAVVHALDEAIGLQDRCAAAITDLRKGAS